MPRPCLHDRPRFALTLPVLTTELRSRMRGLRAPILLFASTVLAMLVGLLLLALQWETLAGQSFSMATSTQYAELGRKLFGGVLTAMGAVCLLLAPGLAAGAIVQERERGSLDLLYLTPLSSRNILLGKLSSHLAFLLITMLCALPVAALGITFGGVSPAQMGWGLAMLLALALAFGCVGLYCSTRFPRTATAVAVSYAVCLGWTLFMPGIAYLHDQTFNYGTAGLLALSVPGFVIAAALGWLTIVLLLRRRVHVAVRIGVWLVCTMGWALLMLPLHKYFGRALNEFLYLNPEYLLAGNPIATLVNLLDWWERIYPFWYTPPWVAYGYSPGMVVLHLIIAGCCFAAARWRMDAERHLL